MRLHTSFCILNSNLDVVKLTILTNYFVFSKAKNHSGTTVYKLGMKMRLPT